MIGSASIAGRAATGREPGPAISLTGARVWISQLTTESATAFSLEWSYERGDHDGERRGHDEDEFGDALHLAPLG
jgi:hypothetical protein